MQSAAHSPKNSARSIEKRIFEFSDLASFLKAVVEDKKLNNPRWSLGVWARQLGIQGRGTLPNFISGRRVPNEETLKKIIAGFDFSEYESQYFEALVAMATKGTSVIARKVANVALVLEKSGEDYLEFNEKEFRTISDPKILILREMVKLEGFSTENPEWIQRHLKLFKMSQAEIKNAFVLLAEVGLLKNREGKWVQTDIHYKTPSDQQSQAIQKFHETSLELSKQALLEIPSTERHFNSITFTSNPEDLPEIKAMIHEFSRRLMEKFDRPEGKTVFQLHSQLVPQAEVK